MTDEDFKRLMKSVLTNPSTRFSDSDHEVIRRILTAMEDGKRGIMISEQPDGEPDFILTALTRCEAIRLMAKLQQRLAEAITRGE